LTEAAIQGNIAFLEVYAKARGDLMISD